MTWLLAKVDLRLLTPSSVLWIIATGFIAYVLLAPSSRHKSGLPRCGKDPGPFNLRSWSARIDFLRRGSKLVYERYQRVSPQATMADNDLRCVHILEQECQLCDSDLVG